MPMFPTNKSESSWPESWHGHCTSLQTLGVLKTKLYLIISADSRQAVSRDPQRLKQIQIFIFCTSGVGNH